MNFKFVYLFVFICMKSVLGWVFTEVKYNPRWGMVDEQEVNGVDSEFTDEIDEPFIQERMSLIFPGTKWCGPGDTAESYDDLGEEKETDACCRDHDHCPDVIRAGETKHNLTNEAFYSKLSCECDEEFKQCLHKANRRTSKQVGKLYFNIILTQCFREDYLIVGCVKHSGWLRKKCVQYEFDENGDKLYQWFDVPNF